MKFLVHSDQRPGLTDEENRRLYGAMQDFYTGIPDGVTLECDYVKADRSGSYSVLDVPDRAALDAILEPFEGLVVLEIVEVLPSAVG